MSADDGPTNVINMPRIGSPAPPPVPPVPTLGEPAPAPVPGVGAGAGPVRISPWDAPLVPVAPSTPAAVTTALRSDGTTGQPAPGDAGPPRTGALSLAAILAIALAAFEGIQTWVQESGPRRAQADAHRRELELLAAKAGAAGAGHRAEAAGIRSRNNGAGRGVQSSHDYGRGALRRGSTGRGRGGSGTGPGGSRGSVSGLHSGSGRAGGTSGGRGPSGPGTTPSGRRRDGSGSSGGFFGRSGGAGGNGGRRNAGPGSGGGFFGRSTGPGTGSGSGSGGRRGGSGGSGSGSGSGSGGHRSPRQAVRDWWTRKHNNGKTPTGGAVGPRPAGPSGTTPGAKNSKSNSGRTPTFWAAVGDTADRRWRARQASNTPPGGPNRQTASTIKAPPGTPGAAGSSTATKPGATSRTSFWDAVQQTMGGRWANRRAAWKTPPPGTSKPPPGTSKPPPGPAAGTPPGPAAGGTSGAAPGSAGVPPTSGPPGDASQEWLYREFLWRMGMGRSSPFDVRPDTVTYRVDQVDPPGTHAKRWQPTPIAPARAALPRTGPPALPRAPQRPAGPRPGTSRKDPLPMAPVPARSAPSAVPAGQHATDITLDSALEALTHLATASMSTHDEAEALLRQAQRLLADLEALEQDLAVDHNVRGPRTRAALADLTEAVTNLMTHARRMAQRSLEGAELAESEEIAMGRHYRPVQDATVDSGLAAYGPSARIHNEN